MAQVTLSPTTLVQAVGSGILLGAVYGIIAAGLALILGNLKVINLSHGSFYALGGFLAYTFHAGWNLGPLTSWILVGSIAFLISAGVYLVVVGPLRERRTTAAVLTLGLGLLMENLFNLVWGSHHLYLPVDLRVTRVLGVRINLQEVVIAVFAALILGGLLWFLNTRPGLALRVTAQDPEVATTLGIDVARMHLVTFGFSGSLAAVAGTLMSPLTTVYASMGRGPLVVGLATVLLGGMGNIHGTVVAALLLGVMSTLTGFYFSPAWSYVVSLALIVLVLIVRPGGIFGALFRPD